MKKKNIGKVVAAVSLSCLLVGPLFLNDYSVSASEEVSKAVKDFGVGQGIQWPEQVVAPYADMTAYATDAALSNNGAINLAEISRQTGQKFFKLGFMQSRGLKNGRIDWAWGGYNGLSEIDNDQWQYEGIKTSIRELRALGGDAAVSFGGLNTGAFWETTQDEDILYNAYLEVIQGYGFTRVDFDVEAAAMDYTKNLANAKAVKRLQDTTGVEVVLTLPVMNTGLISTGLNVLQAYLEAGVDLTAVNIMTMCYGSSVPDYAQGSLDAVDNTMRQLQNYYQQFAGITLTEEEAYGKLGTTPSIGFESEAHPYFTTSMFNKVVNHAREKGLAMVSYWSMNRDAKIDNGQGQVSTPFEFLNTAQLFLESEVPEDLEDTEAPTTPKNLSVAFLTTKQARLEWSESSDNDRVKQYNLSLVGGAEEITTSTSDLSYTFNELNSTTAYTVTLTAEDRSGNVSEPTTITFTTLEDVVTDIPEWDANTIYVAGDRVMHEGLEYEAKWWTQNDIPSESGEYGPWRLVTS